MQSHALLRCLGLGLILLRAAMTPASGAAIWTNSASGLWNEPLNWSGNVVPSRTGVYVTNDTTKTVTVDAQTPVTNLVVSGLSVWAPPDTTNTVLLSDLGPDRFLLSSNVNIEIRMRGALHVANSAVVVTNVFGGNGVAFNVWAGQVTLDGGSIVVRESAAITNLGTFTRIGRSNAATLSINAGFMHSSMMEVGQAGLPNARSHGTIRMAGGLLYVPGELSVGTSPGCTGVVDMVGGEIRVPDHRTNITRIGDKGVGLVSVANATVSVANVSVGRHDSSEGTLVIQTGGLVGGVDDFSIGRFPNSTGRVVVAEGQLVVTNHPIWIGREGNGWMTVSNGLISAQTFLVAAVPTNTASGTVEVRGGTALVSSNVTIGSPGFATGFLTLSGGDLVSTNAEQSASLVVHAGTLALDGGTATVDGLFVTNSAGRIQFNAGTLVAGAGGTVASNGQPFVIGDGIQPATMELRGGTHVFADGLVISSNATLTGCGTVVGTVVNHGVNSVACDALPKIVQHPVNWTVTPGTPVTFTVAATSSSPMTFQWRRNGSPLPEAGSNSATFTIPSAQAEHTGAYDVVVSNDSGSVTSTPAVLHVVVPPQVTSITVGGGTASLVIASETGLGYRLEYKDRLEDPIWTTIGSVPGNGGTLTLTDPTAGSQTRFYRVRVD